MPARTRSRAVRWVPPQNKPVGSEVNECNAYLAAELATLPPDSVVLALGGVAELVLVGLSWWTLVMGGLIAFGFIAFHPGGLRDLLGRWARSAWYSLRTRRIVYLPPHSASPAAAGLPCAVAMGIGAVAFNFLGIPWA